MTRERLLDQEMPQANSKHSEDPLKAFSIKKKNKKIARVTKKRDDADNEVSDSSSSDEGNRDDIPESYYKSNLNPD